MKTRILTLSLVFLASLSFAQSPTAPALDFNMFIENNGYLVTNETEGPVAIGCDLWIKGNYQVSTNQKGTFKVGGLPTTLVVGNKVKFKAGNSLQVNSNGYVKIGDCTGANVWYKDQNNAFSPIRVTKNNYYNSTPYLHLQANSQNLGVSATNNPICQSNVIDFGDAFSKLKTNSSNLSLCSHNAQLTNANGQAVTVSNLPSQVKINLSSGKNVLNLTGSQLNSVQIFTYNQKPSASQYLIINVDAQGTFNWNVWNQAGVGQQDCPYILYNFYNTTKLVIKGNSTIEGTVLAPKAYIEKIVNQSNIEGQVIGTFFYHKGGELHYAPFAPNEQGCAPSNTPTASSFNFSDSAMCLIGNYFSFFNNSTGDGPLSYKWTFGDGDTSTSTNTAHTYSTPGTYQVTLITTSNNGSDTSTKSVTVHPMPLANFSVNDTVQDSTNNQFIFTALQTTGIQNYKWNFGDSSLSNGTSSVSNHIYAGPGAYTVNLDVTDVNGCENNACLLVTVEQDSCGSGNDGGLESHSLEGIVSAMNYKNAKNSKQKFNPHTAPKFEKSGINFGSRGNGSPTLEQFFPASLKMGGSAIKSSPDHLLGITNAKEITSVDYLVNNKTRASVLASITNEKPYSHTKYTCDRFQKSEIVFLDKVTIEQEDFILFVLKRHNGVYEYGIEFTTGYDVGENQFGLQSNWLIDEYAPKDTNYNFQVWATNAEITKNLVGEIIRNLSVKKPVVSIQPFELPAVYVTKGERIGSELVLSVLNTTKDPFLTVKWVGRPNEQTVFDTLYKTVLTKEFETEEVRFNVNDEYEFDIYFYLNDKLMDKIYMADANWGLDYVRTYTSVSNYEITNDASRNYADQYPLYRNVSLEANTADYISLYKDLTAGTLPTDLSNYKGLSFYAKGEGKMLIRLSSANITNWRAQYKTYIDLNPEGELHQIAFADFYSDSSSANISTTQLSNISFTYESKSFDYEDIAYDLSEAAFVKEFVEIDKNVSVDELTTPHKTLSIYPNPNNGRFSLIFNSTVAGEASIVVTDVQGRIINKTQISDSEEGENQVQIFLGDELEVGTYMVTLEFENGQRQFAKMVKH